MGARTLPGHKSQEGPSAVGPHAPDSVRSQGLTVCVQWLGAGGRLPNSLLRSPLSPYKIQITDEKLIVPCLGAVGERGEEE